MIAIDEKNETITVIEQIDPTKPGRNIFTVKFEDISTSDLKKIRDNYNFTLTKVKSLTEPES